MGRIDVSSLALCDIQTTPAHTRTVAVVGLGYVGLPVAIELGRVGACVGYDICTQRLIELKNGYDRTREVDEKSLHDSSVTFTDSLDDLRNSDFYIIAVPTPVDASKQPDLGNVFKASALVGTVLKKGDIVVYESTVYPGATEEECGPILEQVSGLKCGVDFFLGYSPERINPGDPAHGLRNVVKVVAGQTPDVLETVASVYGSIVPAGVYKAPSIRVAEAAKAIENTQRDLNIALMNELALIFDRMELDTIEVLNAAATKWNFVPFRPGLVGGHCIGVDPYYLTHKAEEYGYTPQVILSGRRVNDGMGRFVAQRTIKEMIKADPNLTGRTVTLLGLTFKENVSDIRNSRSADVYEELKDYCLNVQVSDPLALASEAKHLYGIDLVKFSDLQPAEAVVISVAHDQYGGLTMEELRGIAAPGAIIMDIKGVLNPVSVKEAGFSIWRL